MSHFSFIETQITKKEHLLEALRGLGHAPETGRVFARGYGGAKTPVDVRIPMRGRYDIGFRKVGATYQVVADWSFVGEVTPEAFVRRLTQQYAYQAIRQTMTEQGFVVDRQETREDGSIHLVLCRTH